MLQFSLESVFRAIRRSAESRRGSFPNVQISANVAESGKTRKPSSTVVSISLMGANKRRKIGIRPAHSGRQIFSRLRVGPFGRPYSNSGTLEEQGACICPRGPETSDKDLGKTLSRESQRCGA